MSFYHSFGVNVAYTQPSSPQPIGHSNARWERDEKEDTKTALDLIYELKNKLRKLHPVAEELIQIMFINR